MECEMKGVIDMKCYNDIESRVDNAMNQATAALNEAKKAAIEFDKVNERYIRLRTRAESGRMTMVYKQDKLGTKVQSSGRGGNGDDLLIEIVELSKMTDVQRALLLLARERVRNLIEECCGKGTREAIALMARHISFPAIPFGDIPRKYPDKFQTKNQANAAYRKGIIKVSQHFLDDAA